MSDFLTVLAYAALPALGNLAGVVLAEAVRPPGWINGALLHGAAGIAIGLIAVELLPRSQESVPVPAIAAATFLGILASLAIAAALKKLSLHAGGRAGAWMVYAAIGADLLSDGLVTGVGSAAALSLGLLLAAAQLVANIPGGFAAGANLRQQETGRRTRLLAGLGVSLPIFISASLGYFVLRDAPEVYRGLSLAFIVGLLLAATLEDLVPEADAPKPPRWSSTLCIALGFCGILLFSSALGE